MNKYVIGDVHGGYRALEQIFSHLEINEEDMFIFLGDYVDGWSEPVEVIEFLNDFQTKSNCIFIKGNHDIHLMDYLSGKEPEEIWLLHGGLVTFNSYQKINEETKKRHLDFLERLVNYYIDEDNRLFIHAGFTSMHGPAFEHTETYFQWDRTLWEVARTLDKSISKESSLYPKRLLCFNEIYIGHTPTTNYGVFTPMQGCNVWNMDTGAGFKGPLTMLNVHSKSYIQSERLTLLYPDEKGRNK